MKTSLTICAFFLFSIAFTQDVRVNEFQIRGGIGVAGYNTNTALNYDFLGTPVVDSRSGEAATLHFPIEIRYELGKRISIGLNSRLGSYLYDPVVAEEGEKSNRFLLIGPAGDFNFVTRDNFRFYGGLGLHFLRLNTYETVDFGGILEGFGIPGLGELPLFAQTEINNSMLWSGLNLSVVTGVQWYIAGGPVGIYYNLGYDAANMNLREFESTQPSFGAFFDQLLGPLVQNTTGSLDVSGFKMDAGLTFRLR